MFIPPPPVAQHPRVRSWFKLSLSPVSYFAQPTGGPVPPRVCPRPRELRWPPPGLPARLPAGCACGGGALARRARCAATCWGSAPSWRPPPARPPRSAVPQPAPAAPCRPRRQAALPPGVHPEPGRRGVCGGCRPPAWPAPPARLPGQRRPPACLPPPVRSVPALGADDPPQPKPCPLLDPARPAPPRPTPRARPAPPHPSCPTTPAPPRPPTAAAWPTSTPCSSRPGCGSSTSRRVPTSRGRDLPVGPTPEG